MKKRNKCIPRHLHPDPEHWVKKGQILEGEGSL